MRRSARITALFLSVVLAASVAPVAAQAAAPDSSASGVFDLGDDIVQAPAKLRAKPGSTINVIPTPGVNVVHTVDVSVVTVSGGDAGDADVIVPTNDTEAAAFVAELNTYWHAETNGDVTLALGRFEKKNITAACDMSGTSDTTEAVYNAAVAASFNGDYASGWVANHHLLALSTKECAGGLGSLGGTIGGGRMVSGAGSGEPFSVPVAAHEFGHNLGLAHANAAICANSSYDSTAASFGTPSMPSTCDTEEYADYLDIMGVSVDGALPHVSTPQKYAYGWLPGSITTVTTTTTATLKPYGGTGIRALRIVTGAETYFVEYRTKDSADENSFEFGSKMCPVEGLFNTYQRCYGTIPDDGGVRIVRALPDQGDHPGTSVLAVGPITGEAADPKRRDTHLGAGESFTNVNGAFTLAVSTPNPTTGVSVSVTFGSAPITPTTTTLNLTGTTAVYGASAPTATATVSPNTASGSIQFYDGTTPLGSPVTVVGGSAPLALPLNLVAGAHAIKATFVPSSSSWVTSSSDPQTVTTTVPATVKLAAASNAGGPGIRVSATVTLADGTAPSGSVQFSEGGGVYGSTPVNGGVGTLSIPNITAGNHALTATYKPSKANYLEGTVSAVVTVTEFIEEDDTEDEPAPIVKSATKVTVKFTSLKVKLAKKAVVTVTVSGSKPTGKITVLSKGKKIATVTLKASANGKAKITLPKFKKVGSYKITVSYGGSDLFKASTSKAATLKIVK